MTAPEAFEKWWQALPLRNGEITADHIRQAWDSGVLFARKQAAAIVANAHESAKEHGTPIWADELAAEINSQI